jgi:hypothetical protein
VSDDLYAKRMAVISDALRGLAAELTKLADLYDEVARTRANLPIDLTGPAAEATHSLLHHLQQRGHVVPQEFLAFLCNACAHIQAQSAPAQSPSAQQEPLSKRVPNAKLH